MLAPSETAMQPFLTSVRASSPSSSFWVAQGRATSQGTPHGRLAGVEGRALELVGIFGDAAAALGLVRLDPVDLLLGRCPSGSWMKPSLSDRVSTLPPSWTIFSAAWVATLPEPEITARLPVEVAAACA